MKCNILENEVDLRLKITTPYPFNQSAVTIRAFSYCQPHSCQRQLEIRHHQTRFRYRQSQLF